MNEVPFNWSVSLWRKDPKVTVLPTLARGVWRELLDVMHESDRSGVITGTRDELARLGRCSAVELDQTLHELAKHKTADITERNGVVTLINRKMKREFDAREHCRLRVQHHRKGGSDPPRNVAVTPPYKVQGDKGTDKAYKPLSGHVKELADRLEASLGVQWVNDAGKWVNRCKSKPHKTKRVIAEVESAIKESRIKTTPAQYAEQIWKEFA